MHSLVALLFLTCSHEAPTGESLSKPFLDIEDNKVEGLLVGVWRISTVNHVPSFRVVMLGFAAFGANRVALHIVFWTADKKALCLLIGFAGKGKLHV